MLAAAPPVTAAPAPHDDAPVLLAAKGDRDDGSDEQGFDKLRDAYYWSDLLAGDGGGIDGDTAAALRDRAAQANDSTATAGKVGGVPAGAWTNQGQSPVVQVARTSNTLEAVSGRVTALVVRPDGSLIAGGAQGGVWTYDQTTKVWTSRSANSDTQSVGALAASTSNPDVVYLGTGEGNLAGDSYYGNGVYRSDDGGKSWRRVSGNAFVGVSTSQLVVDPRNPNHLFVATLRGRGGAQRVTPPGTKVYGVYESRDGGATWALRKGTTDELHGATDLVMDPQQPSTLWASFWGDQIYRTTDSGATWQPAMVEDLLLLARLDDGDVASAGRTDLSQVVVEAVVDARDLAPDHRWRLAVPDTPVGVDGPPDRWRRVVVNLLTNARSHTPPGTLVEIALTGAGDGVTLTVVDDGPGIATVVQDSLFERFTRGDVARTSSSGGSGLGLALARAVVRAYGGSIEVASRPGRTAFTVRAPVPAPAREPLDAL